MLTEPYATESEILGRLARELAGPDPDPVDCFRLLRGLPATFLPCEMDDPGELHRRLVAALRDLGRLSVPLALGLTMHLYTLATLATLPRPRLPIRGWKRRAFLATVRDRRWLFASCGSFRTHRRGREARATAIAGGYRLSGTKDYVSLAGVADRILVGIETEDDRILIFAADGQAGGLRFGEPSFDDSMRLSCTRSLDFDDYVLADREVLFSISEASGPGFIPMFQRAWFHALAAAPYLGGAEAAVDALCTSCAASRSRRTGDGLTELDGMVAEIGRSCAEVEAARLVVERIGQSLAEAARDGDVAAACRESAVAKSTATRLAFEVVQRAHQTMGTDAARPGSPVTDLLQQAAVGRLHPTTEFDLLRELGESRLRPYRRESARDRDPPPVGARRGLRPRGGPP